MMNLDRIDVMGYWNETIFQFTDGQKSLHREYLLKKEAGQILLFSIIIVIFTSE